MAIYAQTGSHQFVSYDDPQFITGNPHVRSGLTRQGVSWAFTATSGASFWLPLTWLSLMLDVELFGLNAGGHHLMSAGIHALNAMVLFLFLARVTGSTWRSAFVAALFAVHPLHVESVAWAAERKDVLSTLFLLLSLWAYVRFAERPVLWRYLGVVLFFGMSLMSKPMGVTLPFTLLLLDWWPLCRIEGMAPEGDGALGNFPPVSWRRILWEKVPLFLMAAGSVAVTLTYKGGTSWIGSLDAFPLRVRIANAVVSYAAYLWKTAWPSSLAVFYPHPATLPAGIPAWEVAGAILLLAGISFLVFRQGRRRPYLAVGWLWYLGTLIPVIGLVQVGDQAMADRYTYVPLIGVFIMISWGGESLFKRYNFNKKIVWATSISILLACVVTSNTQASYWKDSKTLFGHALRVTDNNWVAHHNIGVVLYGELKFEEAIVHYREAIRLHNDFPEAHFNLGVVLGQLGKHEEAAAHFREVLRLDPVDLLARDNLINILKQQGDSGGIIDVYTVYLRNKPDDAAAQYTLGNLLAGQGRAREAIQRFREAIRVNPEFAAAYNNLGAALEREGRMEEAIESFREAIRLKPGYPLAVQNLEKAVAANNKTGKIGSR